MERLGDESFASCDSLSLLHVPSSLKFLGMYVFLNCSNLVPSNIDSSETNKVVAFLRLDKREREEKLRLYPSESWNDSDYY
ncbi:hypothetical protein TL16_g09700 [Triparma laevis f. inornata]|uniref:Uncharacterized protein n=1 Tax=Triparma laevis f. inornata TaxID=1714386 RepID=A0A9W7B4A0_9STRA|nr:hypothetical protein TL16_g09700 [Triparma laevis f. inornata]